MAITIREAFGSGSSGVTKEETRTGNLWHVYGSNDEAAIIDYVAANTFFLLGAHSSMVLVRSQIEVEPIADLHWLAKVDYKSNRQVDESTYQFDTTGGTAHRTQAIDSIRRIGAAPIPNFDGAINVSEDRVDGLDVTIPSLKYTETHTLAAATVDLAYIKTLSELTGSINNAAYKGFDEQTVLFLGATGSISTGNADAEWDVTYNFDISPSTTVTVGSLGDIWKEGWSYLWVRYTDTENANMVVKQPLSAYVEQVYPAVDLSLIGIGS